MSRDASKKTWNSHSVTNTGALNTAIRHADQKLPSHSLKLWCGLCHHRTAGPGEQGSAASSLILRTLPPLSAAKIKRLLQFLELNVMQLCPVFNQCKTLPQPSDFQIWAFSNGTILQALPILQNIPSYTR